MFTILLLIFIASLFSGTFLPEEFKEDIFYQIIERFEDLIGEAKDLSNIDQILNLIMLIFTNNVIVALIIYILFPTIIGSVLMLISQGFLIGAVITYGEVEKGLINLIQQFGCSNPPEYMVDLVRVLSLLPHGILEIPGIILAVIASIKMSNYIIYIFKKKFLKNINDEATEKKSIITEIKPYVKDSLKYLLACIFLLLIAAFIEVLITPAVVALAIILTPC